jgi:hypothetical protein
MISTIQDGADAQENGLLHTAHKSMGVREWYVVKAQAMANLSNGTTTSAICDDGSEPSDYEDGVMWGGAAAPSLGRSRPPEAQGAQ